MSSDYEFDDIDSAVLEQLDIIEATQSQLESTATTIAGTSRGTLTAGSSKSPKRAFNPARVSTTNTGRSPVPVPHKVFEINSDDFDDLSFEINDADLQKLDSIVLDAYASKPVSEKQPQSRAVPRTVFRNGLGNAQPLPLQQPQAGPSKARSFSRVSSTGGRQTTLFGDVIPEDSSPSRKSSNNTSSSSRVPLHREKSASTQRELFKKTKKWDHTAFAKSGKRKKLANGKGKAPAQDGENDEGEEEEMEFEQFPAPFISPGVSLYYIYAYNFLTNMTLIAACVLVCVYLFNLC
jgi:ATP-dependent DNA helicase MPH1